MFSRDLREQVASGDITVSIRLWSRSRVKVGGRYATAGVVIEIDSLEVLPFSAVTDEDVRDLGRDRPRGAPRPGRTLGPNQRRHLGLPD